LYIYDTIHYFTQTTTKKSTKTIITAILWNVFTNMIRILSQHFNKVADRQTRVK